MATAARSRKRFGGLLFGTVVVGALVLVLSSVLRLYVWALSDEVSTPKIDPEQTIEAIMPGIESVDLETRADAAHAIGELLTRSVSADQPPRYFQRGLAALHQALQDPDPVVRVAVVTALGKLSRGSAIAKDDVSAALRDPEQDVQVAAATALIRVSDDDCAEALAALANVLMDPVSATNRRKVVNALEAAGRPGEDTVVWAILTMLRSDDEVLRLVAVDCVSYIGPEGHRLVPALAPMWDSNDIALCCPAALASASVMDRDQNWDHRVDAALEKTVTAVSLSLNERTKALDALLQHAPHVVRRSGLTLASQLLNHPTADVRLAAASLLHMIEPSILAGSDSFAAPTGDSNP